MNVKATFCIINSSFLWEKSKNYHRFFPMGNLVLTKPIFFPDFDSDLTGFMNQADHLNFVKKSVFDRVNFSTSKKKDRVKIILFTSMTLPLKLRDTLLNSRSIWLYLSHIFSSW